MGKTNPLNDNDMAEFIALSKTRSDSELSWSVDVADIDSKVYDLAPRNPNRNSVVEHRAPLDVLDELYEIDNETTRILENLRGLL
jgi:type I restriction enzyme M protein